MEGCEPVSVVACGAGTGAELEHRGCLRHGPLAEAVLFTVRLVGLITLSMLVTAAPASGLAGQASGAQPNRPTGDKQATVRGAHTGTVLLALGSGYSNRQEAERVRPLQRRLRRAGYAPGPTDGHYGPRTEQAVTRFQGEHGLAVDGIAGPRTLAAVSRPSVVLYPGTGYATGGSGAVRALQRRLTRAGYAPGPIDGRYGPRTEQAVTRFQREHGLAVDGIAGPRTVARLASERKPQAAARPSPPRTSHRRGSRPVRGGGSRSQSETARSPRALAPGRPRSPNNSTSSPSLALVGALVMLLALGLVAARSRAYRRRNRQSAGADAQAMRADRPDSAALTPTKSSCTASPTQATAASSRDLTSVHHAERAFNAAVVLEEQGDVTAAVASYRRADLLGHGAAACNLGVLLHEQGDWTSAEECFRRADHRGDPAGAFNLAVLLEEEGDHIEALHVYERAAQLGDPATADRARTAANALRGRVERSAVARKGGARDDS